MRKLMVNCLVLAAVFCGCDSDPVTRSSGSALPDLSVTPMENAEAELAALWLSGEIVAPTSLYERIRDDLAMIRAEWGDSVPETEVTFRMWWEPSILEAGFSGPTFDSIMDSTYHAWDSLNEFYRLTDYSSSFSPFVRLSFEGRLNALRLVDIYKGLPGMFWVANSEYVGDWPVMLPVKDRRTMKYFFRNAWGDCPSGCLYSDVFYFTVVDDSVDYVGAVLYDEWEQADTVVWLDTLGAAFRRYREWNSWADESE